jgi:hypothetical protein
MPHVRFPVPSFCLLTLFDPEIFPLKTPFLIKAALVCNDQWTPAGCIIHKAADQLNKLIQSSAFYPTPAFRLSSGNENTGLPGAMPAEARETGF